MSHVHHAGRGSSPDNWVGGSGQGGNGDWQTAADWSGHAVPASSASATFALGGLAYTVTGDATIAGILIEADQVTFTGSITQESTGGGQFLTGIFGASLTLASSAYVDGQGINFGSGTFFEDQGLLITTGGIADVMLVDGLDAQVITSGALQVNQLYVYNGASFTGSVGLNAGGSLTMDSSTTFGGGSLTLAGSAWIYAAAAPSGDGGQVSIADPIVFAAGGGMDVASDPNVTLLLGGPISGAGGLYVSGGTVELTGDNTYTGGTMVQNGTLVVDSNGGVPGNGLYLVDGAVVNGSSGGLSGDIFAAGTSDTVSAGGGNIYAYMSNAGTMTFTGGTGTSTVSGGDGTDLVFKGAGNDYGVAFGGNVELNASASTGNETLFGGTGNTTILGGTGTDQAICGSGVTDVFTNMGSMTVFAGTGTLLLGYSYGFAGGTTGVVGFDTSRDEIGLYGYTPGTAEQALAGAVVSDGNTILHLTDNSTIVLFGVTNLGSSNFV